MLKRAFDLIVSIPVLLLAAPVIGICVLAIRAQSPGPAIFRQQRVGRFGQTFTCLKLRSMYVGVADMPSHEAHADNVTSVGRFIRRTKLDELPQLLNVIRGEMSLVGPRPCLPSQAELIRLRRENGIFAVRPGITGLGQIQGVDMSDPARLAAIDRQYVENRSFVGDLRILVATVRGTGRGDRVSSGDDAPRV